MEFCDKIKKIRTDNNLTQEQFAEKLYVSRTAVSKWESGKGYPSIDSLKYMSKLFNISKVLSMLPSLTQTISKFLYDWFIKLFKQFSKNFSQL